MTINIFNILWKNSPQQLAAALGRRLGVERGACRASGRGMAFQKCPNAPDRHVPEMEAERYFTTEDGRRLPVLPDYRYSVKNGWRMSFSLQAMDLLEANGLLSDEEAAFLAEAKGRRTISRPLAEINDYCRPVFERHRDLFMPETMTGPDFLPTLRPCKEELEKRIEDAASAYAEKLAQLKNLGLFHAKPGMRVLEVGFGSGISSAAMGRLGFKVCAIDNEYGETCFTRALISHLVRDTGTSADFRKDDIVKGAGFEDGAFDIIISTSVLEHIQDVSGALREMRRVLAPSGIMLHSLNPYHAPNGGHVRGILDSPWAHSRLNSREIERYIKTLRPHEADDALDFIVNDLNPSLTAVALQKNLVTEGFEIAGWRENMTGSEHVEGLTAEIIEDCMKTNPTLTIVDLLSATIEFVAVKAHRDHDAI